MWSFLFLALLSGGAEPAFARVFDFNTENFAVYFRGVGGLSQLGDQGFARAFDPDLIALSAPKARYNFGGELGTVFSLLPQVNLRLGLEVMQTKAAKEASGLSASDVELFELNSEVFVWHPNAMIEIMVHVQPRSRFLLLGGVGWSTAHLTNEFSMTSAGTAQLGKDSYSEKASQALMSWQAGAAMELHFTDTSTLHLEGGYREMVFSQLTHKLAVDSLAQDSMAKGDRLLNFDDSQRPLNMGGLYLALSFRFYVRFL